MTKKKLLNERLMGKTIIRYITDIPDEEILWHGRETMKFGIRDSRFES